jgi:hypothetical protein
VASASTEEREHGSLPIVRPFAACAATMASADFSPRRSCELRRPFQAQGEISPGKNIGLRCTTAGFTLPRLGHEGFAITCPLALLGPASYPVSVRRPAALLPASFTLSSRSNALRFTSLAVTSSREDFHLQVDAHAGRTSESPPLRRDGLSDRLAGGPFFGGLGVAVLYAVMRVIAERKFRSWSSTLPNLARAAACASARLTSAGNCRLFSPPRAPRCCG